MRQILGVTFQSPSLDRKLTVQENLKHQLRVRSLRFRPASQNRAPVSNDWELLTDAASWSVSCLAGYSGAWKSPKVCCIAPACCSWMSPARTRYHAQIELWKYLRELRQEMSLTIVVTTHLLDEAEDCDRLGVLHEGQMVALDTPDALRGSVGRHFLTIRSREPERLASDITAQFGVAVQRVGDLLRIEREGGHDLLRDVVAQFGTAITSVTLGKPTLEDVFVQRTGKQFW